MEALVESMAAEYRRYKALADAAMDQLSENELSAKGPQEGNSIATIAWHISGNLASRFTDFLTTDGEKPWRNREEEFAARSPSRRELYEKWDHGWQILFNSISTLSDSDLRKGITIRGTSLKVHEALHRSLAHTSYHVGQIVYIAKSLRGADWKYLSVPPGGTDAYNRNPTSERADVHASKLNNSRS